MAVIAGAAVQCEPHVPPLAAARAVDDVPQLPEALPAVVPVWQK
jgi:hypothetical protein